MCNLARLTLRYAGPAHEAPSSVILKVPSNLPENRGVGDHFGFYEREGRFYAEISESLPVRTPHCYYNHIDIEARRVRVADRGLRRPNDGQPGGRYLVRAGRRGGESAGARARRMVEVAEARDARAGCRVLSTRESSRRAASIAGFGTTSSSCSATVFLRGGRARRANRSVLGGGVHRLSTTATPITLCHGDFRADNLMFDDPSTGGEHVGILDWQIAYRSGGVADICYLIDAVDDRRGSASPRP